jgi:DNA polymerase
MAKKGFFTSSQLRTKKQKSTSSIPKCGKCKLYKHCINPKMPPTGKGIEKILYIAEAPGAREDRKNEQLIGSSGQYLRRVSKRAGHSIDNGRKTNACICRPKDNKKPTDDQIQCCFPNLKKEIDSFKPNVIVLLGGTALKSLLKHKFHGDVDSINKWRGFVIPDREYNAWICPVFHPSYIDRDTTPKVAEKIFEDDLKCAFAMIDVPLPTVKNEQDCVEIIKHPKEAITFIKEILKKKRSLTAFDYETSGLKPHDKRHKIKSCAICDDIDHAVAFPMFSDDKFIECFREYLRAPYAKKICANMKFERDWSYQKLGPVKGFFFDTMIGGHILDNRSGITSLTIQGYMNLGIDPYDEHIKPFLQSKKGGGNDFNRIDDIDMYDLLIYNGIDTLGEFKLALVQMDRFGIKYNHLYDKTTGHDLAPQYKIAEKVLRRK